jgi:phosphate-selective porin OprO and OprP
VLIQIAVATLVSGSIAAFPGTSLSTLPAASYAVEAPAAAQDSGTIGKKDKKKKEKKPKKAKQAKNPADDTPAPDETVDPDAVVVDQGRGGDVFGWKQHPSIRYGSLRLDFQAKLQEDTHSSYPDAKGLADPVTGEPKYFDLHRNRVGIQGKVFKHIEFEVERELTEKELTERDILENIPSKSQWKDVYVNVDYIKNAQIQVGKFKIPFGLDELTGDSHNDYVYRSLGANYLASARDVGVMAHGRFFKRGLSYSVGVFRHDGDNATSKKIEGGDQTVAARFSGLPFRRFGVPGLELGTAFAISKLTDDSFRPNGLRGRTVMTQDTFFESVYVKGQRRRWEADADWTGGPVSIRTEFTEVLDQRQQQGFADQDLPDARGRSWYLSGTWVLTGEEKTRPVKPANPFLQGGFGSVELAARFDRLWFDSVDGGAGFRGPRAEIIEPSGDRVFTFGVNWTLNRFIKLQVNAIRERVEDPARSPVPNGDPFWSRVFRLQLVL